ncbi:MAG: hypothetical protein R3D71_06730 [Rickettsiales bacterium]
MSSIAQYHAITAYKEVIADNVDVYFNYLYYASILYIALYSLYHLAGVNGACS